MLIIKIDENGNILWQKVFDICDWDIGYDVAEMSDRTYIVAGGISCSENIGLVLLKLSPEGNLIWLKFYGGGSDIYSIQKISNNNLIVSGSNYSMLTESRDFLVLKLDSNGNIIWQKTYGGIGNKYSYGIKELKDGNLLVLGETDSYGSGDLDVLILKPYKNGNILWKKLTEV